MKLLVPEPGSEVAGALWSRGTRIFSSRILYVEARAALAAARRDGRVRRGQFGLARERLEQFVDEVDAVELDPVLAVAAGELADRHALTANDAIHLASALTLTKADVVVATWDQRLREATVRSGLALAPAR